MISLSAVLGGLLEIGRGDGMVGVGRAPMMMTHSAFMASMNGADTAPEPTPSMRAATDEAWQSRVQWSTLLVPKPWRTSFWNR